MYLVVSRFADLEDGKHLYNVGDVFPRKGLVVPDERIHELLGSSNKCHTPLIKEDVSEPSGASQKAKTGVNPPKTSEAKGKQRRKREKA